MKSRTVTPKRAIAMDGLRGIAILLVVWFHLWQISWQGASVTLAGMTLTLQPIAETGFIGVELFFFLSGFCIFYPYARNAFTGKPAPALREFYRRRTFKIVPSYVLAIAVLIALGHQKYASLGEAFRDVAFHLLFIHNWFAATYGSIDGVMWSLGVEVQFYLLFPLIAWCALRRPIVTFVTLIALAIAFRLGVEMHGPAYLGQLSNQLPAVLDLFAVGMAVAYGYSYLRERRPKLAERSWLWTALALAGVVFATALILECFAIRYEPNGFDLWKLHFRTALALAFGAIGIGSLLAHPAWVRVIANPVLVFLGAISYNLYIWHQVVGNAIVQAPWPIKATADPHDDPHWQLVYPFVAIPAVLIVASIVTYAFEQPILRWEHRTFGRSKPLKELRAS